MKCAWKGKKERCDFHVRFYVCDRMYVQLDSCCVELNEWKKCGE